MTSNVERLKHQTQLLEETGMLLDKLTGLNYFTREQREFLNKFLHKFPSAVNLVYLASTSEDFHHIIPPLLEKISKLVSGTLDGSASGGTDEQQLNLNSLPTAQRCNGPIFNITIPVSKAEEPLANKNSRAPTTLDDVSKVGEFKGSSKKNINANNAIPTVGDDRVSIDNANAARATINFTSGGGWPATPKLDALPTGYRSQSLKRVTFNLPDTNTPLYNRYGKGADMIARMGWVSGGLGKSGTGIVEPIAQASFTHREGLGSRTVDAVWPSYDSSTIVPTEQQPWDNALSIDVKAIKRLSKVRTAPVLPSDSLRKSTRHLRTRLVKEGNSQSQNGPNTRFIELSANIASRDCGVTRQHPGVVVEVLHSQRKGDQEIQVDDSDHQKIFEYTGRKKYHAINTNTSLCGIVHSSAFKIEKEPAYRNNEDEIDSRGWLGPWTTFPSDFGGGSERERENLACSGYCTAPANKVSGVIDDEEEAHPDGWFGPTNFGAQLDAILGSEKWDD